jgi:hypothetical protein
MRERDAVRLNRFRPEDFLRHVEHFCEVSPFSLGSLEIVVLWMRQDIVESQKTRLDVSNLMVAAIAKLTFTDGVVQDARMQMINTTPPAVSLGRSVAMREEFLDEMSVPLAAFGMGKVEELPHREVPGMRRHKVEKTGFNFGVPEGSKRSELGW